jgi:hypothetical protein
MPASDGSSAKRYRTIVEGVALVSEYRRSGLSAGDFARERGVTRKSLNYWIGRVGALAHASSAASAFVEVTPPPPRLASSESAPGATAGAAIEVRLSGGASIIVSAGYDATLLRSVVQALSC